MIEKTVLDMVTALAVIVNAEVGNWDKAAAYFYGASGKSAYTIYGRAEKRCANYGTCTRPRWRGCRKHGHRSGSHRQRRR